MFVCLLIQRLRKHNRVIEFFLFRTFFNAGRDVDHGRRRLRCRGGCRCRRRLHRFTRKRKWCQLANKCRLTERCNKEKCRPTQLQKPHYVLRLPPIERESKPKKKRDGNTVQKPKRRVHEEEKEKAKHTDTERERDRFLYGDESQQDKHLSSQQVFALVYNISNVHTRHIAAGCVAGWLLCTRSNTCDILFCVFFLFFICCGSSIFESSLCATIKKTYLNIVNTKDT